jgi:hypothetical protein
MRCVQDEIAKTTHGIADSINASKIAKTHVPLRSGDAERLISGHAFAVRARSLPLCIKPSSLRAVVCRCIAPGRRLLTAVRRTTCLGRDEDLQ